LRVFLGATALTAILSLTACGGEGGFYAPRSSATARRPQHKAPNVPAVSAATFVADNASIDLFVIRSSELALQRSSSARIHDFAMMMIEAHNGTSAQLAFAGRRLNLLPSAALRSTEQAMLDSLQTSSRFDADYVRDERLVHQQAIALDASYAGNGDSPTLRPVAAAALPIEQRHLRLTTNL
jgi:predicted outer membrane protein